MALARRLKLLLAASLVASVLAGPVQRPLRAKPHEDDDDDTPLPLVIWHGLGDTFSNPALADIASLADAVHPGTFVYVVRLGESGNDDKTASFFGNVTTQLAEVCAALAAHPILSTAPAIDALGFSQGGQFLRGYVERCNSPPVRSLVTFGAQHTGITAFRDCPATDLLCRGAVALLNRNKWSDWVQSQVVPAQYFRDPSDAEAYDAYLEHSNFLADINNERPLKNETYKANVARLRNFAMYMFADDTVAIPKESAWFEDAGPGGKGSVPLRATSLYTEDWLGLRELDRKGGLKFLTTPGDHMQLTAGVLNSTFREFFGPYGKEFANVAEL